MTEKRFTWLKKDVYAPQIVITDSLTEKDLTPTDCYGLLNELAKENEQLKQRVNVLDDQITAQGIVIEGYQNRNQKLFDENGQLKESNERFSKTVAEQIIMIKKYREENEQLKQSNSQLARVNREGVKKVQKLADENEQLKKGNKTLADGLTAYFESKIKKE